MNSKTLKTIFFLAALPASGSVLAHMDNHDHIGAASGLQHLLLEHGPVVLALAMAAVTVLLWARGRVKDRDHPDQE